MIDICLSTQLPEQMKIQKLDSFWHCVYLKSVVIVQLKINFVVFFILFIFCSPKIPN